MRLELVTGTTGALIAKVMNHEVEAAFVAEPFTADELEGDPVFCEELVLITPKSFRKVKTPRDIGRTTLIAFATGCSYRRRLEAWLGERGGWCRSGSWSSARTTRSWPVSRRAPGSRSCRAR